MPDLKVTLLQSVLCWENVDQNLEMFSRKIDGIETPTNLILLPETFNTGFTMNPSKFAEYINGKSVSWMKAKAKATNCAIAGSLIIAENGAYFNRLVHCRLDGSISTYNKRHRFSLGGEDKEFAAGQRLLIEKMNGWKINYQVCYDLRFPVWSRNKIDRQTGEALYDCLVYVANWPQKRREAWKQLLIARAIENQCFAIGVNRVGDDGNGIQHAGDSCVIDPYGKVLFHNEFEERAHTEILREEVLNHCRNSLPFLADGDEFDVG